MSKIVDRERLARLANQLDARMKDTVLAEEERARLAENELQESIDDVEDKLGGREIVYLTQIEYDGLSEAEKNADDKAYFVIDAEEYEIWVGTTEELEAITERDVNTIYFEIEDAETGAVTPLSVNNGALELTTDRYQKVSTISSNVQIVFPEVPVNKFTEISLFFTAGANIDLSYSLGCKVRKDGSIVAGSMYEVVCRYNTMTWLVDIKKYS